MSRTDRTPTKASTTSYSYPADGATSSRPHFVTGTTTTGDNPGSASYAADAAGNTVKRPAPGGGEQDLVWDELNQLTEVTKAGDSVARMVYDADGARILRQQGTTTTLYVAGNEISLNTATSVVSANRYYGHAGHTVAVRTGASNDTVTTLVADWQGTIHHQISNSTGALSTTWQDPYGNPRGTPPTAWTGERGFVGGTRDATGLTRVGARDYDPVLQRFITVDPIQDLTDPLQWNPYLYANNTPITKSDPTGLKPCSDYFSCGYQMPKRLQLKKYPAKRIQTQMKRIEQQRSSSSRRPQSRPQTKKPFQQGPPSYNTWTPTQIKLPAAGCHILYMHGCGMPTGPTFFLPGQRDQPWYVQLSNAIGLVLSGKAGLASSKTNPGSKNTTNSAANGGTRLGGRIVTEDALGDVAIRNAMRVKPEPGVFDVIGHGTPSSVSGMSPSQLASAIRARPGWGGQDIRLLSCSTGCPTGNFAQGLANELGVVVRAPTTDIFVSSRGGITFESGGGWRIFSPGG